MIVISTRDFRTNQTKYLNMVKSGAGKFRIFPEMDSETIETPRDLVKDLRNALAEVKEAIAGKRVLQSAESLLDEL